MRRSGWQAVIGWALVILVGTSIPGRDLPPLFPHADKLVHFCLYGVLGVLVARAMSRSLVVRSRRLALAAITGVAAFAAIDEWHQQFVPQRSSDPLDWLADVVGATAGLAIVTITPRPERQL